MIALSLVYMQLYWSRFDGRFTIGWGSDKSFCWVHFGGFHDRCLTLISVSGSKWIHVLFVSKQEPCPKVPYRTWCERYAPAFSKPFGIGSSSFEVRRWHRGKWHCLMHGDLSLVAMLKCLDSEQQQQQQQHKTWKFFFTGIQIKFKKTQF